MTSPPPPPVVETLHTVWGSAYGTAFALATNHHPTDEKSLRAAHLHAKWVADTARAIAQAEWT